MKFFEAAAQSRGIEYRRFDVRKAEEIAPAFEAAARQGLDALIIAIDGIMSANLKLIVQLAAEHRAPTIHGAKEFVEAGGLMSYAVDYRQLQYCLSRSLFCVVFVASTASARAEEIQARVVSVADGDTISVVTAENQQLRVRIAGVGAPEKGQPFADRSRQNLARLTQGKDATLECHKTDRYERKVCKVWVQPADCPTCGHTLDVGLAQISVGLARWFRQFAHEQSPSDRGRYESEETEARLRKRGLWALPDSVPANSRS